MNAKTTPAAEAAREAALSAQNERLAQDNAAMARQLANLTAQVELLSKLGAAAVPALPAGDGKAQMVDATADYGVPPDSDGLFSGGAVVTGNDDLLGDPEPAPAAPALPGLSKRGAR